MRFQATLEGAEMQWRWIAKCPRCSDEESSCVAFSASCWRVAARNQLSCSFIQCLSGVSLAYFRDQMETWRCNAVCCMKYLVQFCRRRHTACTPLCYGTDRANCRSVRNKTSNSAIAETARVTVRAVIAVDWLTITLKVDVKWIYIVKPLRRLGMDHTVLPANYTMPAFTS